MKFRAISSLIGDLLFGTSLVVVATTSAGGAGTTAPKPTLNDPAFQAFCNPKQLGDALAAFDAARITDCALLLAHGEKVLLREHKGVSSKRLFELALNVAADKSDQATLKRLEKALRGKTDADLLALLDIALRTGDKKRKVDPFAAESKSPESLVLYKAMIDEIKLAKSLNDRASLENLHKSIGNLSELTAQQRTQLVSQVKESLGTVAKTADPEDDYLAQLARGSRGAKKVADDPKK